MRRAPPAHKATDPAQLPGQRVNRRDPTPADTADMAEAERQYDMACDIEAWEIARLARSGVFI